VLCNSWWVIKLSHPNLCLERIIRLAVSRHKRHTCMQTNNALAGRNDKIMSTTSASDETHSTEVFRPSFEAIIMSKWRRGTIEDQTWQSHLFTSGDWVRVHGKRGHVTRKDRIRGGETRVKIMLLYYIIDSNIKFKKIPIWQKITYRVFEKYTILKRLWSYRVSSGFHVTS